MPLPSCKYLSCWNGKGQGSPARKPTLIISCFSRVCSLPDTITINHKDSRWVGAWWLGFIITGTVIMLSGIPFWFLPKSLPKPKKDESQSKSTELAAVGEQENFLPEEDQDHHAKKEKPVTFQELAKGIITGFFKRRRCCGGSSGTPQFGHKFHRKTPFNNV